VTKNPRFIKALAVIGFLPFILPVALGIYRMSIESWTLLDWLILYSFIFWPTYIIGAAFIIVSIILSFKNKRR